jgi:hypothetical protein
MTEKQEQEALFAWAQYRTDLQLMLHVVNEGRRSVQHTMALKRQGMKPGVPDILFPVARGGYHGLWIEMKRKDGGRLSPEQRWWQKALLEEGYAVAVCKGFDEARETIDWYLRLKEERR